MTVRPAEISLFDSISKVRDEVSVMGNGRFAGVRFLERRDNQNGLRYDDRSVNCKGSSEAGDVGNQRVVSPDSTSVLTHPSKALF